MAELKTCLEEAGYQNVATILQTGNVVLDSPRKKTEVLGRKLESLIGKAFDYPARLLLLEPEELRKVIAGYPFDKGPDFHQYVVFTDPAGVQALMESCGSLDGATEAVTAGDRVVYWTVQKGHTLDSPFGKCLAKVSTKHLTTNRNIRTLDKILQKCN